MDIAGISSLIRFRGFWVRLCILAVSFTAAGYCLTGYVVDYAESKESRHLLTTTLLVAECIDPATLKRLKGVPEDVHSPQYKNILASLQRLSLHIPYWGHTTLLTLRDGNLVVLADSLPITSKFYQEPGMVYHDSNPEMIAVFTQARATVIGLHKDELGTYVCAGAPIVDPQTGLSVGVIGLTLMAEDWQRGIAVYRWFSIATVGLVFLVVLVLSTATFRCSIINQTLKNEIDEKKRTQKKFQQAEKRFRALFESTSEALMTFEGEQFTSCNAAALKIFGCPSQEDFLQYHLSDLSPPTQPDGTDSMMAGEQHIKKVLQEGTDVFEWLHQDLQGNVFPAEVVLSRIALGERMIIQGRVKDITERKAADKILQEYRDNLEQQVEQRTAELIVAREKAEVADKVKSHFMANVSHELRTPLNGIFGHLYLLQQGNLDAGGRNNAKELEKNARNLNQVIDTILDFSKLDGGELIVESGMFSLPDLLNPVFAEAEAKSRQKGLNFVVVKDATPTVLAGDGKKLAKILSHLLDNAVKYTEQGEITVLLEGKERGNSNIGLHCSVTDSGIGMDRQQVDQLFQSFTQGDGSSTRKYGGLGLGLALCNQLVELLGGKLQVNSEPGRGTTFGFTIPFGSVADSTAEKAVASVAENDRPEESEAADIAPEDIDRAALGQQLKELEGLLEKNDMEAVTRFSGIRTELAAIDRTSTRKLAGCLDNYDFKRAFQHLQDIWKSLGI